MQRYRQGYIYTGIQTNRQRDRYSIQTDTHKQTDIHTSRQIDRQARKHRESLCVREIYAHARARGREKDRQTDRHKETERDRVRQKDRKIILRSV